MHRISIQPARDFSELGRRWQALERRGGEGFFRSWAFLGCLVEERFSGADVLAITQDGHDVALALLGRRGGRRWLNQTGDPVHDAVFIEHNGLLAAPGAEAGMADALRQSGHLEMSGIDEATLQVARGAGWVRLRQSRWAPAIELGNLDRPYLETLSANARAQIRRSQRLYGSDLRLSRAATLQQAHAWFEEMVRVHQTAWHARRQPGAFACRHMRAFHAALITRAYPVGQADLLRVMSGPRHIGTLYNLIGGGRVHCYQSGFSYSADGREKPGLCCHALAIAHYVEAGALTYDLLAGAERYKLTLAQGGEMLHWATSYRPWSAGGVLSAGRQMAGRARRAVLS